MSVALLLGWGQPDAATEHLMELLDSDGALPPLAFADAQRIALPLDGAGCAAAAPTHGQARLQALLREAVAVLVHAPAGACGLPGSVVHALQQLGAAAAGPPPALRMLGWLGAGTPHAQQAAFEQLGAMAEALGVRALRFDAHGDALAQAVRAALLECRAHAPGRPAAARPRAHDLPLHDLPLLDLSVGELSVSPEPAVARAVAEAGARPSRHAPHGGEPLLRQALFEHERRCGTELASLEQVLVTSGATTGLAAVLGACCPAGAAVLVPDPGFPLYWRSVAQGGRQPLAYPACGTDGQPDMEAVARLAPQARAIVWNFPHNPLGTLASERSLAALAEIAQRFDLLVVSDETLADFVWRGTHRSPWNGLLQERTVVLRSFSKSAALGGFRVGWMLCPAPLAGALMTAHWNLAMSTAETAQAAALASLECWDATLHRLRSIGAASRGVALAGLAREGMTCTAPDSGLSLWLELPGGRADDEAFVRELRVAEQLKLRAGAHFGPAGRGHVRLCFAAQPELVGDGVQRLLRFYREARP